MLVELFGLPGSGKSTHSRAWRADGITVVRGLSKADIILENIRFFLRHPIRTVRLFCMLRYAPSKLRYSLFINAFLIQNAKYARARRLSRRGNLVGIDQGHFQNILSLFAVVPSNDRLRSFVRMLPRPDLLLVLDIPEETRIKRLTEREWKPRAEFGADESERFVRVAGDVYKRVVPMFATLGVSHEIVDDALNLRHLVSRNLTYLTNARMPTEKAHGVSIAHMCTAFAKLGVHVTLIVPTRRRIIDTDLWEYYGIPRTFEFKRFYSPDFIGRGLTHPFFFFLQRFVFALYARRRNIPWGIIYTREPEIGYLFSGSHRVIFEAHNWPPGWRGRLQTWLVRGAALVACNSEGTESAAKQHGLTKTVVAPNGFDPEQFARAESKETARARLGIPQDTKIAMYIGALDDRKGVKTLFEASESLPEGVVTIIGGTKGEIEAFSKQYPHIRFLGYQPYRDIANNLAAADILVLPNTATSLESASYNSPIKLFAYMASGKPIIASNVPAIRLFLNKENAILVHPDNPLLLSQQIFTMLEGLGKGHGEVAKTDVRAFTWATRAQKVRDAILDLCY